MDESVKKLVPRYDATSRGSIDGAALGTPYPPTAGLVRVGDAIGGVNTNDLKVGSITELNMIPDLTILSPKDYVFTVQDGALNTTKLQVPPPIPYKFDEATVLAELKKYIDLTYGQHYAAKDSNRQLLEDVEDAGDIVPYCRWNIIKYARRYGRKNGHNRDDLFKVLHYAIILLGSDNKGKIVK